MFHKMLAHIVNCDQYANYLTQPRKNGVKSGCKQGAPQFAAIFVVACSTVFVSAANVTWARVGPSSSTPTPAETSESAQYFIQSRIHNILNTRPNLIPFIDGDNATQQPYSVTTGFTGTPQRFVFGLGASQSKTLNRLAKPGNTLTDRTSYTSGFSASGEIENRMGSREIWTEFSASHADAGTSDSSLRVAYIGAHYFTDDNQLVGFLGQFDWAEEENSASGSTTDSDGWMIGPYIAGQLEEYDLYYEARAAYGQSDNNIRPNGTYEDSFDATRFLVSAKLSGKTEYEDEYTVRPEASILWVEEKQDAYTDTNNNSIASQTVSLGELRFGSSIEHTSTLENGTVFMPRFGISGVWNFGSGSNNASSGVTLPSDDLRARVDFGFTATNPENLMALKSVVFYDGIGASDYDAWGGSVGLTVPLN